MNQELNDVVIHTFYNTLVELTLQQIPHTVRINNSFVMRTNYISWCCTNCKSPWGWYYLDNPNNNIGNITYFGFSDKEEKMLFCLSNNYAGS